MPYVQIKGLASYEEGILEKMLVEELQQQGWSLPPAEFSVMGPGHGNIYRRLDVTNETGLLYEREIRCRSSRDTPTETRELIVEPPLLAALSDFRGGTEQEAIDFDRGDDCVFLSMEPPWQEYFVAGNDTFLADALGHYMGVRLSPDDVDGDESGLYLDRLVLRLQSYGKARTGLEVRDVLRALVKATCPDHRLNSDA